MALNNDEIRRDSQPDPSADPALESQMEEKQQETSSEPAAQETEPEKKESAPQENTTEKKEEPAPQTDSREEADAPAQSEEAEPAEQNNSKDSVEAQKADENSTDESAPDLNDTIDVNVDELLESYRREAEEEDKTFRMIINEGPLPDSGSFSESKKKSKKTGDKAEAGKTDSSKEGSSDSAKGGATSGEKGTDSDASSTAKKVKAEEYLIDTPAYMGLEGDTPKRKRRKRHPHFLYYIAEAFRGMRSHGFMSFAAVGIITACLLIMGTFSLLALNVNNEIDQLMDNNEFLAYVDENYTEDEARALQSKIEAIPNVSEVTFITREEALEDYVSDVEDSSLYEDLDANTVLRDRFSVKVEDLSLIEETSDQVAEIDGIVKISIEIDVANGFVTLRNVVMLVALVLVIILFIISLFIISNTIKLATISRKDEIAVMRMVGATNRFIRWPFIYQGAILGVMGAVIAYILQALLYVGVLNAILSTGENFIMDVIEWSSIGIYVLVIFLIAGLIIGVCGSVMAIRKFLKV